MDKPEETQDLASVVTKETSKEANTFTKEQVEEQVRKARSDALAETGRLRVESEKAVKLATAAQERLNRMLKAQEEQELESHKDDPEALRRIRAEQKARDLESELEKERSTRTELEERQKLIDASVVESTKERNAREIATRLGVDANKLIKLAKYTDGKVESIEEIAKELPKTTNQKLRVDSGGTIGGSASFEEIRAQYIKDPRDPVVKARYLEERSKRKR